MAATESSATRAPTTGNRFLVSTSQVEDTPGEPGDRGAAPSHSSPPRRRMGMAPRHVGRDNGGPTGMRSLRRALIALAALGFVAGAVPLAVALADEGGHQRTLIAVTGPLIGWAFIGNRIFAWLRRDRSAGRWARCCSAAAS